MKKNIIVILIISLLLLSSCGVSEEEMTALSEAGVPEIEVDKPTGTVNAQTEESTDTVVISMRPPKTLNPILNEDETVDKVLSLIFKPLFEINDKQKVVPVLAESYDLSADGLTLNIKLKDDIKFSDGTKLTAGDVVFTMDSIGNAGSSYYKSVLSGIDSYYASDEHTVIIKYTSPRGTCMYNLCFPVIPEHYYKGGMSVESNISFKPLGNGEYSFESYRIVRELNLVRNDGKGIKRVKVIISPDKQTDIDLFEQGISNAIGVSASEWGRIGTKRKVNTITAASNNFEFLGFNLNNEIFQNLNFRKAVACAIPSNEIADNIYLGHAEKSLVPVNPKSWLYCTTSKTNYEYNIDEAFTYLRASGFNEKQLKFNLIVNEENNERNETAKIVASSLNQLGMEVNVVPMKYADYINALKDDNFDMFIGGANFSYVPDLRCFLSADSREEPGINYINYSDAGMETLLLNAREAVGENNFKAQFDQIQKSFYEQVPCVGIVFKDSILIADDKIKNCTECKPYNHLSNVSKWYISND